MGKQLHEIEAQLNTHEQHDKDRFEFLQRVIFGDKLTGEMGMKEKVDEMHDILTNVRGANRVFGGTVNYIKMIMIVVGIVGIIKGWWTSAIMAVINK